MYLKLLQEYESQWSAENLTAFYKSFTALPSAEIMSLSKKTARAVTEIGYTLRSPILSADQEPEHMISMVKDLTDDPEHPFKYIFRSHSGDQVGELYPFQHRVLSTVVVNTILKLGFATCITVAELDALFCTAAVAVECTLQELASGRPDVYVDFGVHNFKDRYILLSEYIRDHIKPNAELSARWEAFKARVIARLADITKYRV
jgi:hypothetical protein